jgi:hypothetical protein
MHYAVLRLVGNVTTWAAVLAMTAMANLPVARADEAQAKALFKAMSDYLSAQQTLSYEYDTTLEIVTGTAALLCWLSCSGLCASMSAGTSWPRVSSASSP